MHSNSDIYKLHLTPNNFPLYVAIIRMIPYFRASSLGLMLRFLLIGIFSMTLFAAKAQDGFEVGGNVSINTSWILNQNAYELFNVTCQDDPALWGSEPDYSITIGYGFGASFGWRSGDWWGFRAELNYAKAGQNYKDSFSSTICTGHNDFKRKFALHYLQLPLLARFTAVNRSDVKWYVVAGPQLGFLLGAKESVTLSDEVQDETIFTPTRDKVKSIDLALLVGVGADIFLQKNLYINVGFTTYFGLIDMNGSAVQDFISDNDGSYQASRNFNAGVQVGVHYIFDWVGGLYR